MAYTTINKSTDYFNTKLYTGNGGTNAITGVGHQPDWNWIKCRSHADSSQIFDVLRTTYALRSDGTNAEAVGNGWTSLDSDGFTLNGDSSGGNVNNSGRTYASWNWKANGAGSVDSSTGSISATVSANATAGFSIIKFTNPSSGNFTIPHGLGVAPDMLIFKCSGGVQSWFVLHKDLSSFTDRYLRLQTTASEITYTMQSQAPTSTLLYLNSGGVSNGNTETICYAFSSKTGYSKHDSYTGNGNADGTFVYTGFKPAFVITKANLSNRNWVILDNKRLGYNDKNYRLFPNLNNAEDTTSGIVDFTSNGFKFRSNNNVVNESSVTYIYMAFGQSLVGSNNVPCTAR